MNIQGGGISFEISGTNEKLRKILEESKTAISKFSGDAVKGGKDIDASFTATAKAIEQAFKKVDAVIDENLQGIKQLEEQNQQLQTLMGQAFMSGDDKGYRALQQQVAENNNIIRARQQIIEQGQQIISELTQEEQSLHKQEEQSQKNVERTQSLKAQLRECREQLALMEANGQRGTEEFRRLQMEAGRLTDAIGDANTQARIFSHDNANLQGVISGVSGVAGAFTAAQGAMSLFIGENENLQKAMLKVQSLMSITMGLQQVYNTLNKDSAFMLTTVAKAKDMLTAANARLATALGISTAAAQALMATLTLGLSAAITAIVVIVSKMTSESQKAAEKQKKFNEEVAKAAGKPLASYTALKAEWESLTGSMKEKEKWVQDNADKFEALGLNVNDAKTAEDVLIKNSKAFVEACIAKAKALAAQQVATEKYTEIIKKQAEIEKMPDTVVRYTPSTTPGAAGTYSTVKNQEKIDAQAELEKMEEEAKKLIDMQTQFAKEEKEALNKMGEAAKKTIEGSVEAAEEELARLQRLYKRAANDKERKEIYDQIVAQQKQVDSISFKKEEKKKDPYLSMLQKRKEAYAKYARWSQSEDEVVRKAASKEFAELLKDGESYIDYLEKQRDSLSSKANKTAKDLAHLATINNEIAEATKQTVLNDFETQLNKELKLCDTIGQRLEVIEQRRKEIEGDNSETGRGKAEILKDAEENTTQQAKEETAQLLQEYAGYLNEKLTFEESYARKRELLMKAVEQATTKNQKAVAEAALEELERKKKEYELRGGRERYDELKERYKTYQEEVTAIQKRYAEEREEAAKAEDFAMIDEINRREREELSKLALQRLTESDSWKQLFMDIKKLSKDTIKKLLDDINSQKIELSAQFSPEDLQAIREQLTKAQNELESKDPFSSLIRSINEVKRALKAEDLINGNDPFVKNLLNKKAQYEKYEKAIKSGNKALARNAKEEFADLLDEGGTYIDNLKNRIAELEEKKITIGLDVDEKEALGKLSLLLDKEVGAISQLNGNNFRKIMNAGNSLASNFRDVADCISRIAEQTGNEDLKKAADLMNDILTNFEAAEKGAETWGGWWGAIIGGLTDLIPKIVKWTSGDNGLEKKILQNQLAVNKLTNAYSELEHQVKKSLGTERYSLQKAQINNLREQQRGLREMIASEKEKKKSDESAIAQYEEQIAAAGRSIEDIIDDIAQNITQTTAKDLASQIADAFVEAFGEGEDAAKAFGNVADSVLREAVKNALKMQILEKPLQKAIKQLQHDMGFDDEGNGTFDGLTKDERQRFRSAVEKLGAEFSEAMKVYSDIFEETDPSSLSGAIKGASQESIDLLAGQTNAVRVNQVTSLDILRQQLASLSNIDNGVTYIIPDKLQKILDRLTTANVDGLRGQGIID